MKDLKIVPINIWDDYSDGDDTYIYVESSEYSLDESKSILEKLLKYIHCNLSLEMVKMNISLYDSKKFILDLDSRYDKFHFKRYEIVVENLLHTRRVKLVDELSNVVLNDIKLNVYSES